MKLEQYISELLYQYDCVIVPGLGGFVANYKSATIQPIQNTFSPPSKSVSFNKNLSNNDGLLANHIAQNDGVSFDIATKKIEDYVSKINRDLKLKKRILLQNIGSLFLDSENRTQFEPQHTVNFLLESYGLSVYQKQPIKRTTIEEKITKEFKERTTPLVLIKDKENKSKKWMYAAAVLFLAFGTGWMTSNTNLSGNLSYASLNSFTSNTKTVYTPIKTHFTYKNQKNINIKEQIALANKNDFYVPVHFDENETTIIVQLKEKPIAEAVSTYVATSKKELHYHIIGGCFSEKKNAKKMVRKLKKEGFNAFIIGKRKGLWAVSYNSFITRKEAVNALASAQDNNSKAWVLHQ